MIILGQYTNFSFLKLHSKCQSSVICNYNLLKVSTIPLNFIKKNKDNEGKIPLIGKRYNRAQNLIACK